MLFIQIFQHGFCGPISGHVAIDVFLLFVKISSISLRIYIIAINKSFNPHCISNGHYLIAQMIDKFHLLLL